jgi:cell division protein FtsL
VSSVAQSTGAARGRPRAKARAAAGSQARPRLLAGGVVWIVVFALLLAGVVAVNVAVLRLNLQLDEVSRERTELDADLSRLRSELSSASASARIERLATKELGLVQADPETTVYVRIRR